MLHISVVNVKLNDYVFVVVLNYVFYLKLNHIAFSMVGAQLLFEVEALKFEHHSRCRYHVMKLSPFVCSTFHPLRIDVSIIPHVQFW